jgi:hypothetical protein
MYNTSSLPFNRRDILVSVVCLSESLGGWSGPGVVGDGNTLVLEREFVNEMNVCISSTIERNKTGKKKALNGTSRGQRMQC